MLERVTISISASVLNTPAETCGSGFPSKITVAKNMFSGPVITVGGTTWTGAATSRQLVAQNMEAAITNPNRGSQIFVFMRTSLRKLRAGCNSE